MRYRVNTKLSAGRHQEISNLLQLSDGVPLIQLLVCLPMILQEGQSENKKEI